MNQILEYITKIFEHYGIVAIFASVSIDNIGLPFPIQFAYLFGQKLVKSGQYSFLFMVFLFTLAHIFGSYISYKLGTMGDSYLNRKLKNNENVVKTHKKLRLWFKKYGNLTVFLTRFIGYVRPWSSFVAGLSGVKTLPFIIYSALGSLIFSIICLYFSEALIRIWTLYPQFEIAIIVFLIISFFGFFAYIFLHNIIRKIKKDKK